MGVKKYTSEVIKEGKRVRWPKREELVPAIVVVLVITVFAAAILAVSDLAAGTLLQQLKNAFAAIK